MLPELLYEVYKYIAPEQYLKLNALTILKHLVDTFRDPLEAKYIYFNGEPVKGLNHGLKYIALTNPTYRWVEHGIRWRLIEYASINGYLEVVKLLLKDEIVDPSGHYNCAIRYASGNGHFEIVKLLLGDERVDPSDVGNNAIRWASRYGHLEIVKLLLKDKRVRRSLTGTQIDKYLKQINYKNDSYYHLIIIPIQKCFQSYCTKSTNI